MKETSVFLALIFLLIIISLFSFQLVSAVETEINIKTYSGHDIMISTLYPGSVYSLIESYYGESDSDGKFSKLISLSQNTFDLKIWVKNNNQVIVSERFDSLKAGETTNIVMLLGETELVESFDEPVQNNTSYNETAVNDSTQTNFTRTDNVSQNSNTGSGITGLSTSEDTGQGSFFKNNILYMIFGALLLAGAVFFTLVKLNKFPMNSNDGTGKKVKNVKVVKLSEVKAAKTERIGDYKKAIQDAESKIKDAQKEINQLKNVEKVDAIKKRMEADKKQLEKLGGGESEDTDD